MSNISFQDNSAQFLAELSQRIDKALTAVGIHIEGEAKEELNNSPKRIDTGLLRNSITYALSGEAPAISSYHAERGSNRITKGKHAGERRSASAKNAGSVKVGYYNGTAPSDPDNARAVYVGSNVEYAAYV